MPLQVRTPQNSPPSIVLRSRIENALVGQGLVRVFVGPGGAIRVTTSLPKLLHGSNMYLLKNQAEVDAAVELLGDFMKSALPGREWWFTSVECCWQVRAVPAVYIRVMAGMSHPRIRGLPLLVPNESLMWGRKRAETKIRLYDKCMEKLHHPGDVLRFEVACRGKRLLRALGDGDSVVRRLDFARGYKFFRDFLLEFPRAQAVSNEGGATLASVLAVIDAIGLRDGQSVVEIYAHERRLCRKHASALRRDVARAATKFESINLSDIFPEHGPPVAVEVPSIAPAKRARP